MNWYYPQCQEPSGTWNTSSVDMWGLLYFNLAVILKLFFKVNC